MTDNLRVRYLLEIHYIHYICVKYTHTHVPFDYDALYKLVLWLFDIIHQFVLNVNEGTYDEVYDSS